MQIENFVFCKGNYFIILKVVISWTNVLIKKYIFFSIVLVDWKEHWEICKYIKILIFSDKECKMFYIASSCFNTR